MSFIKKAVNEPAYFGEGGLQGFEQRLRKALDDEECVSD